MRPDDIRSHLRPFEPFRIVTTGDTYDIRSPEMVLVGTGAVIIGIPPEPTGHFFERTVRVSLLHIVRIEPLEVSAKGNGQP